MSPRVYPHADVAMITVKQGVRLHSVMVKLLVRLFVTVQVSPPVSPYLVCSPGSRSQRFFLGFGAGLVRAVLSVLCTFVDIGNLN
jgi:hypothetical protein